MLRRLLATASVLIAFVPAAPAVAQLPGLTLTFTQPSGTGGPTDSFDVWVRLSLAPTAARLAFDGSAPPDFGLPPGFIPANGTPTGGGPSQPFAAYTGAVTNTAFGCSGTFTTGCISGPPYNFQFNTSSADPTRPTFNFLPSFTLNPGDSFDYVFGRFVPSAGPVAAGTYTFTLSFATLNVNGLNASGDPLTAFVTLAQTCPPGGPACSFSRTIVGAAVVPEPATALLLAGGLVGVAGIARRRRSA